MIGQMKLDSANLSNFLSLASRILLEYLGTVRESFNSTIRMKKITSMVGTWPIT